ncbi:hypothetical protein WA016_03741 [Myxococcus stipitatus]
MAWVPSMRNGPCSSESPSPRMESMSITGAGWCWPRNPADVREGRRLPLAARRGGPPREGCRRGEGSRCGPCPRARTRCPWEGRNIMRPTATAVTIPPASRPIQAFERGGGDSSALAPAPPPGDCRARARTLLEGGTRVSMGKHPLGLYERVVTVRAARAGMQMFQHSRACSRGEGAGALVSACREKGHMMGLISTGVCPRCLRLEPTTAAQVLGQGASRWISQERTS